MKTLLSKYPGKIFIVSGEGVEGWPEEYKGKRTELAIKQKLTKEKCHGDRWARAYIYSHSNELGSIYINLETGEMEHINNLSRKEC